MRSQANSMHIVPHLKRQFVKFGALLQQHIGLLISQSRILKRVVHKDVQLATSFLRDLRKRLLHLCILAVVAQHGHTPATGLSNELCRLRDRILPSARHEDRRPELSETDCDTFADAPARASHASCAAPEVENGGAAGTAATAALGVAGLSAAQRRRAEEEALQAYPAQHLRQRSLAIRRARTSEQRSSLRRRSLPPTTRSRTCCSRSGRDNMPVMSVSRQGSKRSATSQQTRPARHESNSMLRTTRAGKRGGLPCQMHEGNGQTHLLISCT
mmetsp:Transcript_57425/g.186545  ORF Transcript_57425/g.186545 Transcript_57425/m.186545 type:complete len:272 (-) Transcript_57425:11-826(-)